MDTDVPNEEARRWWGEFEVPAESWRRWRIGSLALWVQRLDSEWRLAWCHEPSGDVSEMPEANLPAPEGPPETAKLERVASHRLGERLLVSPRLADRPVVVRPETSFRLAPGGEVELFVGTPLWIHLRTSEPVQQLLDLPSRRLPDSWFGPSTTEGELCYASRTGARLRRENLRPSPRLALTRVHLSNRGDDDLLLERLNLPVPNLALFVGRGERLWTEAVSVERGADAKLAEVRIEPAPPDDAGMAERIGEARVRMTRNVFSRALGALLG